MESLDAGRTCDATLTKMRAQLFEKGSRGLHGVARAFQLADFDNSHHLDREEFEEALQYAGLFITSQELSAFFKLFDKSGDGFVDFDEFLGALRGELNERRAAMVAKVFNAMDKDGSGYLTVEDMRGTFDAKAHPEVAAGRATEDDVFRSFLNRFEGERKDNRVSYEEFVDYYTDIGASVPDDDYFVQLIGNCWGVSESAMNAADVEKVRRYEDLLREKVRQTCKASESPKTRLLRVFKFFDADATGAVTIEEMTAALQRLGLPLPRKEVLLFFSLYDSAGSGEIAYAELVESLYADE